MGIFPAFFGRILHLQKCVTSSLLVAIFVSQISFVAFLLPSILLAATVTIDTTASTAATAHVFAGSQTVFISDQVGYKFYVDLAGSCAYSKTTNGGTGWGTPITFDSQTDCTSPVVWYDQWTPGDFGTTIHIVSFDTAGATDNLFYNRLDTTSDTLLMGSSPVITTSNSAQVPTYVTGVNNMAITKGTNGNLYITASDASDSFVVRCSSSCNTTAGWTQAGTNFMDVDNDWNLLVPLSGGNILLINRDISADDIRSRVWDGTTWSASWLAVDSNAIENQTYDVGMSATVEHNSGDIFLAYAADNDTFTVQDHDIRTAKYSSGSWSNTSDVFTNNTTKGLTNVSIALDTNLSTVYVMYSARTTPATVTTGNVYYATSSAAMSTWSTEQGPVNATPGDIYGIGANTLSDERIYATWFDPLPDDVFGNTIADISPVVKLSTIGSPIASISASTSDVYLGGTFMIKESITSRSLTDIVISESGTVDGSTALKNVKIRYDVDTSAPYDCVSESYSGSDTQYGTTDSNGFSGANGVAGFADAVTISPTRALCAYVVADVLDTALDASTIRLSVSNPPADILVSGGASVVPLIPVGFTPGTTINNDKLTVGHFHWRNNDGSEVGATSATAGLQDTSLSAIQPNIPKRLRVAISNEGSISTQSTQFRLEYAVAAPTCSGASSWTDVGATDDDWNMFDSSFFLNGSNTTDISTSSGGTTNENTTFLTTNGGVRDTSSQTGGLVLTNANFVELEYSVVASTTATEGATYCFRVTDAGTPLPVYSVYPSATLSADVTLSATGTHSSVAVVPSTNFYTGGAYILRENSASRFVTDITITELGTIDAETFLDTIKIRYDLDTTAPYNCASESYGGSETQFGATDTDGFSGTNGSSTFSGSVSITATQTMCIYIVLDVLTGASNGSTMKFSIEGGGTDVVVSAGSVSPSTQITVSGTTTLSGSLIAQTGYHWRNDNGTEVGATSATVGNQNTGVINHPATTPLRLRLGISNEGAATSSGLNYSLEFGPKITTCSAVGVWTNVGVTSDDWNMFDSVNLTDGNNTTNIATSTGGITDGNTIFLTPNGAVRDITATTGVITLGNTQFTEIEYSLTSTGITAFNTTYCFRVTDGGTPLSQYDTYAEITTAPRRDFKVQRGDTTVTGTGITLTAGVDYTTPASTSKAFVRITNSHNTGAGKNTLGGAQNARDVTAFISNPNNLTTNFTISRPASTLNNTRVSWEIVEFTAATGTDNEMIVRNATTFQFASASTSATGTALATIADDADVVVFITGINNRDAGRNFYYAGQVTASWDAANNRPLFSRGAGGAIVDVSYAVVEYTGINWNIQRIEHSYTATGTVETEIMSPVNSLARTFTHTQKRMSAQGNVNNFGHEVWLSSIGAVSFQLEPGATVPSGHTSVAWVIENQQTSAGAMKVQRSNGNTTDGTEPVQLGISIFSALTALNNSSIFVTTRVVGANSNFPTVNVGASITATSTYVLWRSEASASLLTYRTEIVEWPTNGLAVRQNYYRFYSDNNALIPTDPWPPGVSDLGENTSITVLDEPLGDGDRVRLRMTTKVANANLPAGLYDFKLQYGLRSTTCSAIASWLDVGSATSGTVWRGYNAAAVVNGTSLSTNPPTGGDLLISVSDVAGSYVEENPSPANPYIGEPGDDIEFDWQLEDNGAQARSVYCFRMARNDGSTLDGYFNYPQIRTASFSPVIKNWRWYDDTQNETPLTALASENSAPIEILANNAVALRVTIDDIKNVQGTNVKFKLQYDESNLFTNPRDIMSTSTCSASSTWCYASGTGVNDVKISTKVLSDSDACSSSIGIGCGTHNNSSLYTAGDVHPSGANREYEFYVEHKAARVGAVYYFRLFEMSDNLPVAPNASSTYPSLVAESSRLFMTVTGLPSGTTTAGVVLTASSSPDVVGFGTIPLDTDVTAAHRITLETNATEGYRVLSFARQQLLNSYGTAIPSITGSNATPTAWAVGCLASSTGCVGYHTTDAILSNGSTRFVAPDSYAGLDTTPREIMVGSFPTTDVHDILYRVRVRSLQPAGQYQTEIVYLAIPKY